MLILCKKTDVIGTDWWYERDRIFNFIEDRKGVKREIESRNIIKNEILNQIEAIAFPKYVSFGFISLITFAALGVIYPLALMPLLSQQLIQVLQFSTLVFLLYHFWKSYR